MAFWGPPFVARRRPGAARLRGGTRPAGGTAGADGRAARAGRRPARAAHGRDPDRHRHRRGAGRQHRLGADHELHGDGRCGEPRLQARGHEQALWHQHPGQRRDRAAGGGCDRVARDRLPRSPVWLSPSGCSRSWAARARSIRHPGAARPLRRGSRRLSHRRVGQGARGVRRLPRTAPGRRAGPDVPAAAGDAGVDVKCCTGDVAAGNDGLQFMGRATTPLSDQPKVKAKAWLPGSRNSTSNSRSVTAPLCRTS